jgi:hypothetical protein
MQRAHARLHATANHGLIFNICQMCSLGAALSMEWTVVRCLLICSSLSWMTFHASFPQPRPTRIFWSGLFGLGHLYSLYQHLSEERAVELGSEEQALYAKGFEAFGFTKWQFQQLVAQAERRSVAPGEEIFSECEPIDKVTILLEGAFVYTWHRNLDMTMPERLKLRRDRPEEWREGVDLVTTAPIVIRPDHDGVYIVNTYGAGVPGLHDKHFFDKENDDGHHHHHRNLDHLADGAGTLRWYAGTTATAPCKLLELPRRAVHDLCEEHPRIAAAAANLQIRLLHNQVSR